MNKKGFIVTLNIFISFFIFCIINTPSLKVFYSSEIINIGSLSGLYFLGLIKLYHKNNLSLNKIQTNSLGIFTAMWAILLLYGIIGSNVNVDFLYFTRILSVYLVFLGVLLFVTYERELVFYIVFQALWGLLLAVLLQTLGITTDKGLGQHYLTLGVPLAASIVLLIGTYLSSARTIKRTIYLILPSLVMLFGMVTLLGRAPIIFSLTIVIFFTLVVVIKEKKSILKNMAILLTTVTILLYIISINVSAYWFNRFLRLLAFEESRVIIYRTVLGYIIDNPLGYGLNAYALLRRGYPHNIFLEIFLVGGLPAFIALLIFLMYFIVRLYKISLINNKLVLPFFMMSLYFFLTWNVSFELGGTYMLFGAMAIAISSTNVRSAGITIVGIEKYLRNIQNPGR